ncbi:histidinol-phosphatase [Devosia rhodophyticola]|uniref:Histidinol-phosphatase n=1 Tax=Devosia rhodophyticola TaxID=3026423 RepID=A0ABY7YUY2_9HYPH|nr:histidinol-phosphatase [Devosia rhodophyticola]WDR04855.1 histidinol-phosphatase [Devosia rhodophyticola]
MRPQSLADLDPDLVRKTLLDAADAAASHTMPRFRTALAVDNKWAEGFDPVTEADRQAETVVRELIADRFPDHGIIGEEWDEKATQGRFQWIIDPIDGTRAYISGVPVWGTLIGLMIDGRAVAGLMAQPFTGETYLAMPGDAQYQRQGQTQPLKTSKITELAQAKLTTTTPDLFRKNDTEAQWNALWPQVLQTRYGLDCYGYCLMAAGHIDLVVEAGLKDVDICPLIPLIENAGGIVTTWDGGRAEKGGNCVAAATPELLESTLKVLRDART